MSRGVSYVVLAVGSLVIALAIRPGGVGAEDEPRGHEPRPVCDALLRSPEVNGPIAGPSRTDLLVAGRVGVAETGVGRVRVTETFYGQPPSDELLFASHWVQEGDRILVLEARHWEGRSWALVESVDATPENLLAARALGDARLTRNSLGASIMLVGREMALAQTEDLPSLIIQNDVRRLAVDHVIVGPAELEGQVVRILNSNLSAFSNHKAPLRPEQRIYFIGRGGPDAVAPVVKGRLKPVCYDAHASVGLSLLPRVEAALERRSRYPIVTRVRSWGEAGETERVREITFDGSVADALLMLGADLDGGYTLAARSLALRSALSRDAVLEAIRARMYDHEVGESGRHRLLRRLIHALALIEAQAPTGALDALVVEYLDRVQSATKAPTPPPAYETAPGAEVRRSDVNRALLWLLSEMGRDEALLHAGRLRSERDSQQGPWRREIQFALDFLGVEDTEALLSALHRSKSLPGPIERQIVEPASQSGVFALAHHASLLALEGQDGHVRLRNPLTWEGRSFESLENLQGMAFSPDDAHLYVGGSGGGTVQRLLVSSGECDLVYEGHNEEVADLALLDAGRVLASFSDRGNLVCFHDAASGKLLGRKQVEGFRMEPWPDGHGVIIHSVKERPAYITLPAEHARSGPLFPLGIPPPGWAQTPDGRWLCCTNERVESWIEDPGTLVLYEQGDGGYHEVARITDQDAHAFGRVAISRDGRMVATGGRNRTVRIYAAPKMEKVFEHRFPRNAPSEWTISRLAFSADRMLLVIGFEWSATPGIVRLDTMEVVQPWTGHGGSVSEFFYADGGAELRTIGGDEAICRWDARTLRPLGRYFLPDRFAVSRVHPAGSQLFCLEHWSLRNFSEPGPAWPDGRKARVLDAATGKTVSSFTLAPGYAESGVWWLADPSSITLDLGGKLARLDLRTGTVGEGSDYEGSRLSGAIEEDGKHLYRYGQNFKNWRRVHGWRTNLLTGASEEFKPATRRTLNAEIAGLVPDGKHFWFAGPGLHVFERETCKEVLHLPLVGVSIDAVAASPDGKRLALLSSGALPQGVQTAIGSNDAAILRILEVSTGELLLAHAFQGGARTAQFAPDGRHLTVLTRTGRLLVWGLPDSR